MPADERLVDDGHCPGIDDLDVQTCMHALAPGGTYNVFFDGDATIEVSGDTAGTITASGRRTFHDLQGHVDPDDGLDLRRRVGRGSRAPGGDARARWVDVIKASWQKDAFEVLLRSFERHRLDTPLRSGANARTRSSA